VGTITMVITKNRMYLKLIVNKTFLCKEGLNKYGQVIIKSIYNMIFKANNKILLMKVFMNHLNKNTMNSIWINIKEVVSTQKIYTQGKKLLVKMQRTWWKIMYKKFLQSMKMLCGSIGKIIQKNLKEWYKVKKRN